MQKAKRFAILPAALTVAVLSVAAGVVGDARDSATATVAVRVAPTVTVSPATAVVNLSVSEVGLFSATAVFGVRANVGTVHLAAAATPLFKAGDPDGTEVAPIPLDLAAGIIISPDNASPTSGMPAKADYISDTTVDGMPAKSTQAIPFRSGQLNRFDQAVRVTVTWNHSAPARPTGQYGGSIRLTALALP